MTAAGTDAPIRLLLVDDQELLRRGLAMLLSTVEGLELIAQASDGRSALDAIAEHRPDVVVTDARMPGMDGIELAAESQQRWPELPILVLTTFDDDDLVRGAIAAGASGFLLKDASTDALADAIRAVRSGGMVIDPRVARAAFGQRRGAPMSMTPGGSGRGGPGAPGSGGSADSGGPGRRGPAGTASPIGDAAGDDAEALALLTPAETGVARLVAQGRSNGEIAGELFLAEGTVRNHVSALLRKTGSRDRTALALLLHRAFGAE